MYYVSVTPFAIPPLSLFSPGLGPRGLKASSFTFSITYSTVHIQIKQIMKQVYNISEHKKMKCVSLMQYLIRYPKVFYHAASYKTFWHFPKPVAILKMIITLKILND